ncbi:MAG: CopG family antitoxin [Rickettsiales bacterium]
MPKKNFIDDEEEKIVKSYNNNDFVSTSKSAKLKKTMEKAASNYLKKDARINIRISESDLEGIKIRAAEEGIPYQTLIASVLHKFVSGRLM